MFLVWFVQGLLALLWLLLIPTDTGTYSTARMLLTGLLAAPTLLFGFLSYKTRTVAAAAIFLPPWLYNFLYLAALVLFVLPILLLVSLNALGQTLGITYISYAERLSPLAVLVSVIGLEWCVLHIVVLKPAFAELRKVLVPMLTILLIFAALVALVLYTHWGIVPVRDGSFGNPPTPLLEWQIALAVVLGAAALLMEGRWKLKRLDLIIFGLVYVLTCALWLSEPLIPGPFATAPRAPNFETYPFSDPLVYAQYSQSALVGAGFHWPEIPTRPFYVMQLTWMYALVGQSYMRVIFLQTILLALFPAVLYLLGCELGSRPMGLMVALFAVLRDLTSNHAAPFAENHSYSKLFLSELPTALFLVVFTILVLKWIRSPRPNWFFLSMGGVLSVAVLIRLQSIVLLAPMALMTLLPLWRARRLEWLRGMVLTTVGVMLAFSPWLVRNYYAVGGLVLDNPFSQSMTFARRWSGDTGNTIFPQLPGEPTAQYVSRMNALAVESFRREPTRILNGVANHFANNLIASLYTFPVRDRLAAPMELMWPAYAFWQTGARSLLLSGIYIVLLTLGLAVAWTTHRWAGLLPFIYSLGYNLWTALFLSSGDRFLLPIDWTWHLYYALGLLLLLRVALSGMKNISWATLQVEDQRVETKPVRWQVTVLSAVVVVCIGAALPLTEWAFPEKYPALTQAELAAQLGLQPQAGEVLQYGRAIYPRYYAAGDGEPATAKLGYEPSDEARLVFWLVGPQQGLVVFPLETSPEFFPQAADVWMVGAMDGSVFRARVIKVQVGDKIAVYGR